MKNPDDRIEFEGVTFTRVQLEDALRKMDDLYRFCGKIVIDNTSERTNRFIVLDEATQQAKGITSSCRGLACVYLGGSSKTYMTPGTTYLIWPDNMKEVVGLWPIS